MLFFIHLLFLAQIMRPPSPATVILCLLPHFYFLIVSHTAGFSTILYDSLSRKIMMNIGPDAGACLHPFIHRHKFMAQELVAFMQNLPQEKAIPKGWLRQYASKDSIPGAR